MRPALLSDGSTTVDLAPGVVRFGDLEVHVAAGGLGRGMRFDLTIRNQTSRSVSLPDITVSIPMMSELVLEQGWQSWSVVRVCTPDDVRPERNSAPDWARGMHVADPHAAGQAVAGDQFIVTSAGVVGFLDCRRNFGTVRAYPDRLDAIALLDHVTLAPGAERQLEPLWVGEGDAGPLYAEFAVHWADQASARAPTRPPVGWCSWYQFWHAVTPEAIRANLALAADHGLELVQIDDGWQRAIGDWTSTNERWPEGTASAASEIRSRGVRAGLWTAPFLAADTSELLSSHPDWTATHSSGHPMKAAYNEHGWGGFARALDATNPAVLDHLRATYAKLAAEGFDYHKVDFCYAAALPARRHDPGMTRAEALRAGLEAVRAGIGDEAFLLGCGCPFGPAVGIVDAMRVSPDVAPHWAPKASWPGFDESPPAAVNAVRASVLRAPLHRRVFLNDPDCLLLRPVDTELTPSQRSLLAAVVVGAGGFTILSDDLRHYRDDEWALLEKIRAVLPDVDGPLEIEDPFASPLTVHSATTTLRVDWRDAAPGGPFAELSGRDTR